MSPLGLGNDGLGSLRWPAQSCGVTALKPTLGRIPHATSIEFSDEPIGVQLTAVQGEPGAVVDRTSSSHLSPTEKRSARLMSASTLATASRGPK